MCEAKLPAPLISVLMPVYNNIAFLGESIGSILNQTFKDFELIILDDGSTEPISDVIRALDDPRIIHLKHFVNVGIAGSLNHCLDVARGAFLARQDSDDVSFPTRFAEQIRMFRDDVGLVSSWGFTMGINGRRVPSSADIDLCSHIRVSDEMIQRGIGTDNYILGAASVYRREVFRRIGYYDEVLLRAEDYNYWIRTLQHFGVAIVRRELYKRRRHAHQSKSRLPHLLRQFDFADLARARAKKFPTIKHRLEDWPEASPVVQLFPGKLQR